MSETESIEELKAQLRESRERTRKWRARAKKAEALEEGFDPARVMWCFGSGRTGSTWLSEMFRDLPGWGTWKEPRFGMLFSGEELEHDRAPGHVYSERHRRAWLPATRRFVLTLVGARVRDAEYAFVKDPAGGPGLKLLTEALPESKVVLLVRDPRDVVASWLDALTPRGWSGGKPKHRRSILIPTSVRVEFAAENYVRTLTSAKAAYDAHQGDKLILRYEDLRTDTLGTMTQLFSTLSLPVPDELPEVVGRHSFENVPEGERGPGKFRRKATPGAWKEDLTPEQARRVEEITAPLLREFYGE